MSFVHLHNHTQYSLLDGLPKTEDLLKRAVKLKQPALAITDHGNLFGIPDFVKTAKKYDIKPIIGIETYLVDDMSDRIRRRSFHFLLIAYNEIGFKTLMKLSSDAYTQGFYYRPRIDWNYLDQHNEGLIATTGCLAAPIPQALLSEDYQLAQQLFDRCYSIFGPKRFFVELQHHEGIDELKRINVDLIQLAQKFNIRCIATNDVHYAAPTDARLHDVVLCVQTGKTIHDKERMRFSGNDYYLKSTEEMTDVFGPEATKNTLVIAEMCEPFDIYDSTPKLPSISGNVDQLLFDTAIHGLSKLYSLRKAYDTKSVQRQRFDHEISIIKKMGFSDYFLIVADLCKFAAEEKIWWNVRGSGAGSIVAYSLGITSICPLKHGLIFERFLNPDRVNLPDIDLDFAHSRREDVVAYLLQKYGSDRVAQIATYSIMKSRSSIRDIGRAHGIPLTKVDSIAKSVPFVPGKNITIDAILDPNNEMYSAELNDWAVSDTEAQTIIGDARQVEGHIRHIGTHAAGVVLGDKNLVDRIPLMRVTGKGLGGITAASQWNMKTIDEMGLLKIDFLGLSTLTAMFLACQAIEEKYGHRYDIDTIPFEYDGMQLNNTMLNDAFRMLGNGHTIGVFQLESAGMQTMLRSMKPTEFKHIVAAVALYRPGPKQFIPQYIQSMHSPSKVNSSFDEIRVQEILEDTYGNIVYQEQVMQIAIEIAGYSATEADSIRKAIGKRDAVLMAQHESMFMLGAEIKGHSKTMATSLWDAIKKFAAYSFNRAHATDYAKLSVQTAFLKANYPLEYMYACIAAEETGNKAAKYIGEALRLEIKILPPDINSSKEDIAIEDNNIRFGLSQIKGVKKIAKVITDERENGLFTTIEDFLTRLPSRKIGKTAFKALLYAGAFESLGIDPAIGCDIANNFDHKTIKKQMLSSKRVKAVTTDSECRQHIFKVLGVSLDAPQITFTPTAENQYVTIQGILTDITTRTTKRGEIMSTGTIGNYDLVFFPHIMKTYHNVLEDGIEITASGKLSDTGQLLVKTIVFVPSSENLVAPNTIMF